MKEFGIKAFIRRPCRRLGPLGSVSRFSGHHRDRFPLASETPSGPEAPYSHFSLPQAQLETGQTQESEK